MTVTDIRKDPTALSMTVESEWDAPVARVWQLWADPRKLERWWGPPTYPATVVEHDLRSGGKVSYFMTGPEGNPNDAMPTTRSTVTIAELTSGATRMVIETRFPSLEAMEQMIEMGMEEGLAAAIGQIDVILASA
jgi:uncharacterized protein YndB with AHSA1/START domain